MKDGRKTGETGWRLELVVPFEAATEFTSSEILGRATKAEKLAVIVSTLEDRPLRTRPAAASHSQGGGDDFSYGGGGSSVGEDDIPFAPMAAGRLFLAM